MSTLTAILTLAILTAGQSFEVDTWHDRSADFDHYRTFDWAEPPPPGTWARLRRGERTQDDDIRDHVVAVLSDLGYVHEETEEVDFLVFFRLVHPGHNPRDPISRGLAVFSRLTGKKRDDNVLYFELRDPETDQPVWRGRTGPILLKKQDHRERCRLATAAIFEEFPPEPFAPPAKRAEDERP